MDEPLPTMLPQEMQAKLVGWDDCRAYWRQAGPRLAASSMRWWDLTAKPLAPDLALAFYWMHWNGKIGGFDKLFGVDSRVTAVLRRRPAGWRICHYMEGPMAPMLHLQDYYDMKADPEFRQAHGGN